MTESEWLKSINPVAMLDSFLNAYPAGHLALSVRNPSDRKFLLVACACCRIYGNKKHHLQAVEMAEKLADGLVSASEFRGIIRRRKKLKNLLVADVSRAPQWPLREAFLIYFKDVTAGARAADIFRDIAGNPFRPVARHRLYRAGDPDAPPVIKDRNGHVVLDLCRDCGKVESELSGPCSYLTPTVLAVARGVYADPLPDGTLCPAGLAMLNDALEEDGFPTEVECPDCPVLRKAKVDAWGYLDRDMAEEVIAWGRAKKACRCKGVGKVPHPLLAHLRSPGPHYRGCWAVDLIQGKE